MDDHAGKEALLFQTYTERLGTSRPTEMKFNLPDIIQRHTNLDHLTTPFTHAEIDEVIKEMLADMPLVRTDSVEPFSKRVVLSSKITFTHCVTNSMKAGWTSQV